MEGVEWGEVIENFRFQGVGFSGTSAKYIQNKMMMKMH